MPIVKMNLRQFVQFNQKLRDEHKKIMLEGMRAGALRALPILHQSTESAPPASRGGGVGARDTGSYRQAWKTRNVRNGVAVFNDKIYASVIEQGRRVGTQMPNITDLERWARRKLYPALSKGQYGPRMSKRTREDRAKQAVFPIARAIARRGLRGRNVLGSALNDIILAVEDEIKRHFAASLDKL